MLSDKVKMYDNINKQINIKTQIINILKRELTPMELEYYSYCIGRIKAFRRNEAKNMILPEEERTDSRKISFDFVEETEDEIKRFILASNSSLFNNFEYEELFKNITPKEYSKKQ